MNWKNTITKLLKVDYPFIQAPLLAVTTPEMVAAACNANCLGSLPIGYMTKEKAAEQIKAVKKLTNKTFSVNMFAYVYPGKYPETPTETIKAYYKKYGLAFPEEVPTKDPFTYYTDIIDLIIEENIPSVSFHFGAPDKDSVKKLQSKGIVVMATACCVEEAVILEQHGVDVIIAQGTEAGGNKGTFIEGNLPQVGLIALVPQIIDAVKIPVIAAGGLMEPRSIAAAFTLGASGVQLGSAFLLSKESMCSPSWREAIKNSNDRSTVLSRVWSGRYGRCIPNDFTRDLEKEAFPSPIQQFLTAKLRVVGKEKNDPNIQSLWGGQSAKYAKEKGTQEILEELVKGTGEVLSKPFGFK